MVWARYDRTSGRIERADKSEVDAAERGIQWTLNEIIWVDSLANEHERRKRERALERRIEGLREAVRRWRQKAGVDPPPDDAVLCGAERVLRRGKWVHLERYALPVERNPALIWEAWDYVGGKGGWADRLERLFFDERHGWVAVLRVEEE